MAPVKVCNFVLPTKDKLKIRKPLVEKLRRDRINSSIEQLKALLKTELQGQQPSSKLEKADILETAVFYLQENLRPAAPAGGGRGGRTAAPGGQSYAEGFTRCLEETLGFLSAHNQPTDARQRVAHHFSRVPPQRRRGAAVMCAASRVVSADRNSAPKCVNAGGRQPLWRPW